MLDQLAARHELPPEAMPELRSIYTGLVPVMNWHVLGPFAFDQPPGFAVEKPIDLKASWSGFEGRRVSWRAAKPVDSRGQIDLGRIFPMTTIVRRYALGARSRARPSAKAQMVVGLGRHADGVAQRQEGLRVHAIAAGSSTSRPGSTCRFRAGRTASWFGAATEGAAGNSPLP